VTNSVGVSDDDVPFELRDAFRRADEDWKEQAHHNEILRLTSQHNTYAWTCGRYRKRKGDPIADKAIDRLQRAAFATMMATATPRRETEKNPYRTSIGILVLLLIVIVVGVVYALVFYEPPAKKATTPARPAQSVTP
jgi:hypothetical protein